MNHDNQGTSDADGDAAGSLAREWQIAMRHLEPSDYDIPALPDWASGRDADGRLALAESVADEPFIVADEPVEVKR
jgi:hypothetical protein